MIIPDEEIKRFKLYGYHLTTTRKLELIKNEGLIPKCGTRSKSIGDTREAIYFFPALILIDNWIKLLYKNEDRASLELLRVSLKGIDFTVLNGGEWYTLNSIAPEEIECLDEIYADDVLKVDAKSLVWKPINNKK